VSREPRCTDSLSEDHGRADRRAVGRIAWRLLLAGVGLGALGPALPAVPITVYGRLPDLENVTISPDGARIAYVRNLKDGRAIEIVDLQNGATVGVVRVGEILVRDTLWADGEHLMIRTSMPSPSVFAGADDRILRLQIYDSRTHKLTMIPALDSVSSYLVGTPMVRRIAGKTFVYVHIRQFHWDVNDMVLRCDLDTGEQDVIKEGTTSVLGWLVGPQGNIVAEEDYDRRGQHWVIRIDQHGELTKVAEGIDPIEIPDILGFGPTKDSLLIERVETGEPVRRPLSLDDGKLGDPLAAGGNLDGVLEDPTSNQIIGGIRTEDSPHYVFFDAERQRRWDSITHAFDGALVSFVSASEDFHKVVALVNGPHDIYRYQLVDFDAHKAINLGDVYEGLTKIYPVRRITYAARDRLPIPAYLTTPSATPPTRLALIVLPHGGPEARDSEDFDWIAQALANEGYLVMQANFRGSSLGSRFVDAGYGEFGRKMQTDLSDGVSHLVGEGLVDPDRVCIVGASYGGYAALAGIALQTGIYRCAVSIAGISDPQAYLHWIDNKYSVDETPTQRYWYRFMGVSGPDDKALDSISPLKHVAAVDVPLLLVHGEGDAVVPYEQSDRMIEALRDARKNVSIVKLKNEDHWLSRADTRLQMLQETVAFLRKYNPPERNGPPSVPDAGSGHVSATQANGP
jgi:dipeptidyl aminopeptidase/acylaminoacyl peptidase